MLQYKIDVLAELKKKGYSTYKLRQEKLLGESQIQNIRSGQVPGKDTLNMLCKLLECQPGDILEYIPDSDDPI